MVAMEILTKSWTCYSLIVLIYSSRNDDDIIQLFGYCKSCM